jgi:hypothetical protein
MKYIIKESQVDNLIKIFTKLVNSETYEGVCNIGVDYDDVMNRFVINIFFNRNFFVNKDGGKTSSHMRRVTNDVGGKFLNFTGKTPLIYQHYDSC